MFLEVSSLELLDLVLQFPQLCPQLCLLVQDCLVLLPGFLVWEFHIYTLSIQLITHHADPIPNKYKCAFILPLRQHVTPKIAQQSCYNIQLTPSSISSIKQPPPMRTLTTCSFLNNIGECPESIDSPLQLRLINFLGLKNYMIDNFIFRRKPTKYFIRKKDNAPIMIVHEEQYKAPPGYSASVHLLQTSANSIPVLRLTPKTTAPTSTIVYAHGNGSDMSDSLAFVERLSQFVEAHYVIFDYTGYGESRVRDVGEEIICRDLEIVLAWVTETVKLSEIILWGFSLGTYPAMVVASKYPLCALVLQCPIASVSCLFHTELQPEMKFKQDHFANIDHITQLPPTTRVLIMHSSDDEIIPFSHAKLLYTKYIAKHGEAMIDFIEIAKIRHNSLHKYIVSGVSNQLQREVFAFLTSVMYDNDKKKGKSNSNWADDSIGSINTNNSFSFGESKIKTMNSLPTYINLPPEQVPSKQFSKKRKYFQLSEQLKSIRMRIVQGDIAEVPADMHELVVEDQESKDKEKQSKTKMDKVKQKIIGAGMGGRGVNCFCFQNQ